MMYVFDLANLYFLTDNKCR